VAVSSKVLAHKRVSLASLDPFAFGNPRRMTEGMKGTLQASLTEFGIVEPIVVRVKPGVKPLRYEILNGHHRFDALTTMGEVQADIVVVDLPDDKQARALVLALNRISADWDQEQLQTYVDALLADGGSAEWVSGVTGFTGAELDSLTSAGTDFLDDLAAAGDPEPDREGASTEVPPTGGGPNVNNVPFSLMLTTTQQQAVQAAVRAAKKNLGRKGVTTAEALDTICAAYVAAHAEEP